MRQAMRWDARTRASRHSRGARAAAAGALSSEQPLAAPQQRRRRRLLRQRTLRVGRARLALLLLQRARLRAARAASKRGAGRQRRRQLSRRARGATHRGRVAQQRCRHQSSGQRTRRRHGAWSARDVALSPVRQAGPPALPVCSARSRAVLAASGRRMRYALPAAVEEARGTLRVALQVRFTPLSNERTLRGGSPPAARVQARRMPAAARAAAEAARPRCRCARRSRRRRVRAACCPRRSMRRA